MTTRKRRSIVTVVVVTILGAAIGIDAYHLAQAKRRNAALARNDYLEAGKYPSGHGMLARAFDLHQKGHLREAAVLYARLERVADPTLRIGAKFNLANLYLEQSAWFWWGLLGGLLLIVVSRAELLFLLVIGFTLHAYDVAGILNREQSLLDITSEYPE